MQGDPGTTRFFISLQDPGFELEHLGDTEMDFAITSNRSDLQKSNQPQAYHSVCAFDTSQNAEIVRSFFPRPPLSLPLFLSLSLSPLLACPPFL